LIRRLREYLIPREFLDNSLDSVYPATIVNVGLRWSGKTTLTRKIAAIIEEKVVNAGKNFIYVEGRRQSDVLNYFDENPDELRNDYIFILYEDAGRGFHSRELLYASQREQEKDFLELRHWFEDHGFRKGVLTVVFNIQRLEILGKTYRSESPVVIFKTLPSTDPRDRRVYSRMLGRTRWKFLRALTAMMFFGTMTRDPEVLDIFVNKLKTDPSSLDRNKVKRYGVVLYADGTSKIIDFGPELKQPKNTVIVKQSNDTPWIPKTPEERVIALYWLLLGWYAAKDHYIFQVDELRKYARTIGLKFRNQQLSNIHEEAKELASKATSLILASP